MTIRNILRKDINRCKDILEENDLIKINNLLREFQVSYSMYWPELNFSGPAGWYGEQLSINELMGFKTRLETLERMGIEELSDMIKATRGTHIKNENIISNNVSVSVESIFNQVVNDVQNNGYISELERNEILEKIEELKNVSILKESKVKKWDKVKPILNWVATKGVDIALKIIPLIIKSMEN